MTVKETKRLLSKQNDDNIIVFEAKNLDGNYIIWEPEEKDYKFRINFDKQKKEKI